MSRRNLAIVAALAALAGAYVFFVGMGYDVANSPPSPGPIIALGDSLTQGIGVSAGGTYPEQLSKLIGRPVVNRGVSGETAAEGLARLERAVLAEKPGIVLVCLGGNDLLKNRDVDETFDALDEIVGQCTAQGILVVLIGIEGLPLVSENFGARFKELAGRHRCVYVPDILGGIFGRTALMSDGIHPNAAGYAIFAERIAAALRPHLSAE